MPINRTRCIEVENEYCLVVQLNNELQKIFVSVVTFRLVVNYTFNKIRLGRNFLSTDNNTEFCLPMVEGN